jgi:DNA repair protein RadA/Sms
MARAKTLYVCQSCGGETPKWQGQCPHCNEWNTLVGELQQPRRQAPASAPAAAATLLGSEPSMADPRQTTGIGELDRVLGGGLVPGSVVLLGGDPGIGKSTLTLQAVALMAPRTSVLYTTGEESIKQVALRAQRLGLGNAMVGLLAETAVDQIIGAARSSAARLLVVDSIQTAYSAELEAAPGSVSQLRECTAALVRFAKTEAVAVILIGHVTKEGHIAGPRVLEHMVDTVLYFETDTGSRYRILRAVKNRFGAASEIGVFAMQEQGLREVKNPSAIFLSRHASPVAGSVVTVMREGSRSMLAEVQVLAGDATVANPRRVAVGVDANRLTMLLAIAHRHARLSLAGQDVFANVVGGLRLDETAGDLALVLAAKSSLEDVPLPQDLVVFGELGLAGEIRPVPFGEERLVDAAKHGFKIAIVPAANAPRKAPAGLIVHPCARLAEALSLRLDGGR